MVLTYAELIEILKSINDYYGVGEVQRAQLLRNKAAFKLLEEIADEGVEIGWWTREKAAAILAVGP